MLDASSGALLDRIDTAPSPTSVAVLPDGRRALVTDFGDGTVRVIDTAGG